MHPLPPFDTTYLYAPGLPTRSIQALTLTSFVGSSCGASGTTTPANAPSNSSAPPPGPPIQDAGPRIVPLSPKPEVSAATVPAPWSRRHCPTRLEFALAVAAIKANAASVAAVEISRRVMDGFPSSDLTPRAIGFPYSDPTPRAYDDITPAKPRVFRSAVRRFERNCALNDEERGRRASPSSYPCCPPVGSLAEP